ncbi:MAG: hypothetical protein RR848_07125 [Oscillospiraceae bacterium]
MTIDKKVRNSINNIRLSDKFLIVFMLILMMQLGYNLFSDKIATSATSAIDIVVRTTTAAVFGYFVSSNFQNQNNNNQVSSENGDNIAMPVLSAFDTYRANVNFIGENAQSVKNYNEKRVARHKDNQLQIMVVAVIGLFALVLLLLAKDYTYQSHSSIATVSQLRDFVSGSVGFLVGYSENQS